MSKLFKQIAENNFVETDIDKEFIEREVDYYSENEGKDVEDLEKVKERFTELLQNDYEYICDMISERVSRLWEEAKKN